MAIETGTMYSTAAMLALGDALAICLLEARGFTSQDFARYHPGGTLGKKLYLRVNDLYPNNALPAVPETANLKEVILEITSKRLGATAVLDTTEKLVGIVTDGDLRRMLNQHREIELLHLTARDIMTASPISIASDEFAVTALQLLQARSITQLVVVDEGKLKGFVHLHDLLKEGLL